MVLDESALIAKSPRGVHKEECVPFTPRGNLHGNQYIMHGVCPKVGRQGGAEIGWVGRLLEFAEKPSIANGKKHVALDITNKAMSIILAPTDLCHPLHIEQWRGGARAWLSVVDG